jgi:UDP-glucose 4-epimerase
MAVLVTGATGYIGSHTCVEILRAGGEVVGIDDFSNSKPEVLKLIKEITGKEIKFYQGDVANKELLNKIFEENEIECAIHFAGFKAVGESVEKPLEYYTNNLETTFHLCDVMRKHNVKKIIFSSSASVYGAPKTMPITEDFPTVTESPYATTKLFIERILTDLANSDKDWSVILLRYFNPVGADKSGLIGESPNGRPNNLMPFIVDVARGKYDHVSVFGNDYDTPDGTGVRDYIHVTDLAKGHLAALNKIKNSKGVLTYNLGTGRGYSVLDLIHNFIKATGIEIPYEICPRRLGDVTQCYANSDKAKEELGWQAKLGIEEMCKDAWNYAKHKC